MPTYEYECDGCGHAFERFQSITAPVARKCPRCGKLKLRRLIGTGAGVIFRGSGFYQTEYRSESYRKAAAAEKPGGGDAGAAEGAKGKKKQQEGKAHKEREKEKEKEKAPAKAQAASKADG